MHIWVWEGHQEPGNPSANSRGNCSIFIFQPDHAEEVAVVKDDDLDDLDDLLRHEREKETTELMAPVDIVSMCRS